MIFIVIMKRTRRNPKQIEDTDESVDNNLDMAMEEIKNANIQADAKADEDGENESFDSYCDRRIQEIKDRAKADIEQIKQLKKIYKQDMKTCRRSKKKRGNKETGFTKATEVPASLAKLIGVEEGTLMSRTALTSAVYDVFKQRGLRYEPDKRVLRVDKEMKALFKTTDAVNKSVDPKDPVDVGINFYNLQKYLCRCYD